MTSTQHRFLNPLLTEMPSRNCKKHRSCYAMPAWVRDGFASLEEYTFHHAEEETE